MLDRSNYGKLSLAKTQSPSSRTLILSDSELWDGNTVTLLKTFKEDRSSVVNTVCFSPDGHLILSGNSDCLAFKNLRGTQQFSKLCLFFAGRQIDSKWLC